jgi:hypothetical protein
MDSPNALQKFAICESCTAFVWERLNTGHWSDVSLVWRNLYTVAMILKISAVLDIILANKNPMNLKVRENIIGNLLSKKSNKRGLYFLASYWRHNKNV